MKNLLLIDGHNIVYRAYHRFKDMNFTNNEGFPTGAIFGYRMMLKKILKMFQSDHIAVCFDSPKKTFRHEIYPEYKYGRESNSEMHKQFRYVKDITFHLGLPMFIYPGFEADDIIYTLQCNMIDIFDHIYIFSNDKDLSYLVKSKVTQIPSFEEPPRTITKVTEKFGVLPKGMHLYLSLMGDKSDNIPGVAGIGKVSAAKLVNQFGTFENLKDNYSDLPSSLRLKLFNGLKDLELSYSLVQMKLIDELEYVKEGMIRRCPVDEESLNEIYDKLNFKR